MPESWPLSGFPIYSMWAMEQNMGNLSRPSCFVNSEKTTTVKKRGRKPSPSSLQFKTVGLSPDQWAWLSLWFPDSNPTKQLQELLDRAQKFWPAGPTRFR